MLKDSFFEGQTWMTLVSFDPILENHTLYDIEVLKYRH